MLEAKEKNEKSEKLVDQKEEKKLERADLKDTVESKTKKHLDSVKADVEKDPKVKEKMTAQQKEILDRLSKAKGCEARVQTFAQIADDYGLDAIVSLIPELGDAGSSIVSGIYLLYEAKKAGLGAMSYVKIIGLQAADFFAGAIPVLGDVADYFFKANKWSAESFKKQADKLVEEAKKAGIPEEEIAKISGSAQKLPQLVSHGVKIYQGVKGNSPEKAVA